MPLNCHPVAIRASAGLRTVTRTISRPAIGKSATCRRYRLWVPIERVPQHGPLAKSAVARTSRNTNLVDRPMPDDEARRRQFRRPRSPLHRRKG